jgi:hypothetical protein
VCFLVLEAFFIKFGYKIMKLKIQTILALLLATLFFSSFTEKPEPYIPSVPSYNTAYNYFPSEDNYQWQYLEKSTDKNGTITNERTITAVYDKTTNQINYSNTSYSNWYNSGSRLICCNGSILIDYKQLDCNGDSVLIREENLKNGTFNTFIRTYQFCKTETLYVKGYENRACIKTLQLNTFDDGSTLVIERYFGFGVGLIYEKKVSYDVDELIESMTTKELVSHQF